MASLGERVRGWRIAAYGSMGLLGLGTLLLALVYLLVALAQRLAPGGPSMQLPAGMDPLRVSLGLAAGAVVSLLVLLPPLRRAVARVIPIRPESAVNAVALGLLALLWGQSIGLSGMGPEGFLELNGPLPVGQVLIEEVPLVLMGLFGAGFLFRRSAPETWQRLGLSGLTWRQVALIVAGVAGLIGLQVAISTIGGRLSPQAFGELDQATVALYAGINTPLLAVAVALVSGTAEEVLFRGALQPRLGLLLTALTFGILHLQYGATWALLNIGAVGLVLGLYRQRLNTTSCILVHGLYNLVIFLLPR